MLNKLNVDDFYAAPPPPVPWLVEGLVAQGLMTLLIGDGGLGKSYFSLALAKAVVNKEWFGSMKTHKQREVVILDAENGKDEIHRRVVKMGLRDGVHVYEARGLDLTYGVPLPVVELMGQSRVGLLILDSFSSMWHGDENDRLAIQKVLDPIRELARDTECAVLLLHHTNKTGNIFRGSGAIKNVPEIMVMMGKGYMGRRDKNKYRRWLNWEKCRVGDEPHRTWFELVGDGVMASRAPNRERLDDELWPRDQ